MVEGDGMRGVGGTRGGMVAKGVLDLLGLGRGGEGKSTACVQTKVVASNIRTAAAQGPHPAAASTVPRLRMSIATSKKAPNSETWEFRDQVISSWNWSMYEGCTRISLILMCAYDRIRFI